MEASRSVTSRMLVPLDGSDQAAHALAYVRALATRESEIVLGRVLPASGAYDDPSVRLPSEARPGIELNEDRGALERQARAWGLPAERMSVTLRFGDPAENFLDIAAESDCTLIVLASRGHRAFGRWRFGSVADRLARSAPVPTLMVRPDHVAVASGTAAIVNRLVVPLDGSLRAEHAVPVAGALARQLGIPVQLVRVVPPPDLPDVLAVGTGTAGTPPPPVAIGQRSGRTSASDAAARYLATVGDLALSGVETVIDVRMGEAVPRLLEVVEPTDLVVLTKHRRRGGMRRWPLRGVADKLVRQAIAPVCLVPGTAL